MVTGKVSFAKAQPKPVVAPAPAKPAPAPVQAPAPSPAPAAGGFIVSAGSASLEPVEAGVYKAVLIGLFDIGTQKSVYLGQEKFGRRLVALWELPELHTSGVDPSSGEAYEHPRTLTSTYTMSMGAKARLRHDVEAVRGKRLTKEELAAFDLTQLLGINAQLQITNVSKDGRVYSNVQSVMALMKGQSPSNPETTPAWFHLSCIPKGAAIDDSLLPASMPLWAKGKLMSSPEWVALGGSPMEEPEQQAYGG